jgi:hypothetical protein
VFDFKLVGFAIGTHGTLLDHLAHFGGLGGFSKKVRLSMKVFWLSSGWVIWKKMNRCIFQQKAEQLQTLSERKKKKKKEKKRRFGG